MLPYSLVTTPATSRGLCAAAVLLALLSPPELHAQSQWTYAAGEHFEVYTTGGDHVARRAIEIFDRAHAMFQRVLHAPSADEPRTRLIVFSSTKESAPYASNASVRAFYQSSPDIDFIVLPSLSGDVFPAAVHEYAHLVFRRSGSRYPLWLDEGLAEYFSTLTVEGTKLQVGRAPRERVQAIGFGVRLMPLERLFAITRNSAEYNTPSRAALFYAESWALTHMLVTDERYRDRSAELLARLATGGPTALALTTVYGKPVEDIAKDFSHYVLRGHYRTSDLDAASPAAAAAATVRPSSDFEAGVALATLLSANASRQNDARAAFEALERQTPNDLFLTESLALFHVRGGRMAEARPYLQRAIALGSTKARIYGYYADILRVDAGTADTGEDEVDALFAKALSLAPDDVEVRILLGRSLIQRRRGADALAVLTEITRVPVDYESTFADVLSVARQHARERVADGRLTNVVCDAAGRIFEVTTATGLKRLFDDGRAPDAAALELGCGVQNRLVRVGYDEKPDAAARVDGTVTFVTIR